MFWVFFLNLRTELFNLHYLLHNLNEFGLANGVLSFEKMSKFPTAMYTFWEFAFIWLQWLKQLFLFSSCFSPTEQQWENKLQSILVSSEELTKFIKYGLCRWSVGKETCKPKLAAAEDVFLTFKTNRFLIVKPQRQEKHHTPISSIPKAEKCT